MNINELFYYCSRDEKCKSPFGAVKCNHRINFTFFAKYGVYVDRIMLVIAKDGGEKEYHRMKFKDNKDGYSIFTLSIRPDTGLYWYYFEAHTELGMFELRKGAGGVACTGSGNDYQITVYDASYKTPDYIKGGIIYHIFVDRFAKGEDKDITFSKKGVLKAWDEPVTVVDSDGVYRANDFYGGNLQGIIDKLDYLKSLNVSLLYLSPIFKSASNHRYDTGDYMEIDELIGSEEKFSELIDKASKKGIGIMLDGVFNHTGADSRYFNKFGTYDSIGAYNSKDSEYYDWYYFNHYPDDYACWWGVTVVPTVNKKNESYRRFIFGEKGVIDKWMHKGIKGIRLDVVDELDIDFVDNIRSKVKSVDSDALIIGEVWEDASNKISYSERRPYFQGKQLDGVMNYPFKDAIMGYVMNGDKNIFRETVMNIVENYPKDSIDVSMTFIDTHDTVRAINIFSRINACGTDKVTRSLMRLNDKERLEGTRKMKVASALQYTLPGVPSIYYGDEAGLDGFEDPINRRPFPWDNIDEDLLMHFKKLGEIRKQYRKVFEGRIEFIEHDKLLIYDRFSKSKRIRAVFNMTNEEVNYEVKAENLITGKCENFVLIKPQSFALLRIEQ